MPNGLKQGQMVERMYTELLGLDGKSGMKTDVKETKEKVITIENNMMSKDACKTIRDEDGEKKDKAGNRKDRILMRIKDVILLILAILGFLWGSGVIR